MTIQRFRKTVWGHFRRHGRDLPWRRTRDPYKILVSEIMLQQTQVDRVIPKYTAWLKRFPASKTLAEAPFADVLEAWQGLGYNRRALALRQAAKILAAEKKFPRSYEKILALPGVGPYTANAILAFAFNQPAILIETNIRSVFIDYFFADKKNVNDDDIVPLIEKTLDRRHPREWYWALMDYGARLKKKVPNPNRQSAHYTKQSRFIGSDRQLRGAILKYIGIRPVTTTLLQERLDALKLKIAPTRLEKVLTGLVAEGFIIRRGKKITVAA